MPLQYVTRRQVNQCVGRLQCVVKWVLNKCGKRIINKSTIQLSISSYGAWTRKPITRVIQFDEWEQFFVAKTALLMAIDDT